MQRFTLALVAIAATCALGGLASAETRYVSPDGSDSGDGSASQPWATVQHGASNLAAGDSLIVLPGIYRESVFITASGSAEAPISLYGQAAILESPDPTRSLSAFDVAGTAAYLHIEGFELRGGFDETVYLRPGAHDIELVGLSIHDNHTGIWIDGARNVHVTGVSVSRHHAPGVRIYNGAQSVFFEDVISEFNDDGNGCNGEADGFSADETVSDLRFERVAAVGNSQDGFDIKGSNPSLLGILSRDNGCTGVKLWNAGYIENALVEGQNVGVSIIGSSGADAVIRNATIRNNATGVRIDGEGYTAVVWNSIVAGDGKAITYNDRMILVEDYNLLYRPTAGPLIEYRAAAGEEDFTPRDLEAGAWTERSGQGAHSLCEDPDLDPSDIPMPSPSSPAIDSGSMVGSPPSDLLGVPRPQGAGVDRGAFECVVELPAPVIQRVSIAHRRPGFDRIRMRALVPQMSLPMLATGGFTMTLVSASGSALMQIDFPAGSVDSGDRSATFRTHTSLGDMRIRLSERPEGTVIAIFGDKLSLGSTAPKDIGLWLVPSATVPSRSGDSGGPFDQALRAATIATSK